ncbi:MAG: DUF3842 family protein [Eubacteriales bacterium]|nr:DUF3842 family protein [Eubacteriales bacterium]MDD3863949.1 DUF3842 family protein [Eubacteriales bacterium]MDD4445015.1 DUF3842 family protein [Eubacteriales bacterium]
MNRPVILVIDGQGGGLGKQIIEGIRKSKLLCNIIAVGTNSIASSAMHKAGADNSATGENAVIVNSRNADVIIGPIGIVIADSLFGEISEAMAAAVGRSNARKLLIPINLCNNIVIGVPDLSTNAMLRGVLTQVEEVLDNLK